MLSLRETSRRGLDKKLCTPVQTLSRPTQRYKETPSRHPCGSQTPATHLSRFVNPTNMQRTENERATISASPSFFLSSTCTFPTSPPISSTFSLLSAALFFLFPTRPPPASQSSRPFELTRAVGALRSFSRSSCDVVKSPWAAASSPPPPLPGPLSSSTGGGGGCCGGWSPAEEEGGGGG